MGMIDVEIEGMGKVASFPKGISQEAIDKYIQNKYFSNVEPMAPAAAPTHRQPATAPAPALTPKVNPASYDPVQMFGNVVEQAQAKPGQRQQYVEQYQQQQKDREGARKGMAEVLYPFVKPLRGAGMSLFKGLNEGMKNFSQGMDFVADYLAEQTGTTKGGVFANAARTYEANEEYWKKRAKEDGVGAVTEFLNEAVGGAVPGIAEFMLGVPWYGAKGAAEAKKRGDNQVVGALKGALERGLMGKIMHTAAALNLPLRSATSGVLFEEQARSQGADPEARKKAAITGFMFGAPGRRGGVGIRDLAQETYNIEKEALAKVKNERGGTLDLENGILPKAVEKLKEERGSTGGIPPEEAQRKLKEVVEGAKERGEEVPLYAEKGFVKATRVDGKVYPLQEGHRTYEGIPGLENAKEIEDGYVNGETGEFTTRKETVWGEGPDKFRTSTADEVEGREYNKLDTPKKLDRMNQNLDSIMKKWGVGSFEEFYALGEGIANGDKKAWDKDLWEAYDIQDEIEKLEKGTNSKENNDVTLGMMGGQQIFEFLMKKRGGKDGLPFGAFSALHDRKARVEFDDSKAKFNDAFSQMPVSTTFDHKGKKLGEILDHPELLDGYPELKGVEVVRAPVLFDFLKSNQGWYNEKANKINITPYAVDPWSTLLHEVQHAIQNKEGMATGGSTDKEFLKNNVPDEAIMKEVDGLIKDTRTERDRYVKIVDIDRDYLNKMRDADEGKMDEVGKIREKLELLDEDLDRGRKGWEKGFRDDLITENSFGFGGTRLFSKIAMEKQQLRKRQSQLLEEMGLDELTALFRSEPVEKVYDTFRKEVERYEKALEEADAAMKKLSSSSIDDIRDIVVDKRAFDLYQRTAGEIEARDTEERRGMSMGDREKTPPYSSEGRPVSDWITVNKGGKEKEEVGSTLGFGLGAADPILRGLDRWLSPTKEKLAKQGEPKAPAEEWIKRVAAWGEKHPSVKDENTWNGLTAWLESKRGEKGGVKKEDIMEFLELSKGKWAVREQPYGEINKKEVKRGMRELDRKMAREGITDQDMEEYGRMYDSLDQHREPDPWADRNVPGGIPGTAKVWTLTVPGSGSRIAEIEAKERKVGTDGLTKEEREEWENWKERDNTYISPHFQDKPNVVIHFRTQEIADSTGEKGLLIETIQSDWHQERVDDYYDYTGKGQIPPAPFERTWAEVGLKHALDIAAQDSNIKWVGWSSGKVQNERWGKGVDNTVWVNGNEFASAEEAIDWLNEEYDHGRIKEDDLEFTLQQIQEQQKRASGGFLETLYDKRLPKFAKKYAGKLGGKYRDDVLGTQSPLAGLVIDAIKEYEERTGKTATDEDIQEIREDIELDYGRGDRYISDESKYPIHRIDLTDALRSHINTKGQEFYQMAGPVAGAVAQGVMGKDDENKKIPSKYKSLDEWVKTETEAGYDLKGYIDKYGVPDQSKGQHLTDEFKLPNHITFSTDSKYSNEKTKGGVWRKDSKGKWHYKPSKWVLSQHPMKELQWYFKKHEPDCILDIPK